MRRVWATGRAVKASCAKRAARRVDNPIVPVEKPTARRLFDRVSQNADAIDRPKVVSYLKTLGLGGGLLGGQKLNKGADAFMSKLDTSPADGKVTWKEFVQNSKTLLPPTLSDGQGKLNPALIPHVFQEISHGQPKATKDMVASYIEPQVTGAASLFAGTIAEASGKLALDALDGDGDGSFTQDDLKSLVDDINAQLATA